MSISEGSRLTASKKHGKCKHHRANSTPWSKDIPVPDISGHRIPAAILHTYAGGCQNGICILWLLWLSLADCKLKKPFRGSIYQHIQPCSCKILQACKLVVHYGSDHCLLQRTVSSISTRGQGMLQPHVSQTIYAISVATLMLSHPINILIHQCYIMPGNENCILTGLAKQSMPSHLAHQRGSSLGLELTAQMHTSVLRDLQQPSSEEPAEAAIVHGCRALHQEIG